MLAVLSVMKHGEQGRSSTLLHVINIHWDSRILFSLVSGLTNLDGGTFAIRNAK
jgi:hypothetical protein